MDTTNTVATTADALVRVVRTIVEPGTDLRDVAINIDGASCTVGEEHNLILFPAPGGGWTCRIRHVVDQKLAGDFYVPTMREANWVARTHAAAWVSMKISSLRPDWDWLIPIEM